MRFDREVSASPTARARSLRRRMTFAEQKLWAELRKLGVNFRRQAPIGRYFADFATHGGKLIVEVDGEVHERLDEVVLRDFERQQWLEGQGYRVLRFTNRQVETDVWACVEDIRKALLLDGGGLGGGVAAAFGDERGMEPAPNSAIGPASLRTPPSPAPPPSRRKGA